MFPKWFEVLAALVEKSIRTSTSRIRGASMEGKEGQRGLSGRRGMAMDDERLMKQRGLRN